MSQQSPNQWSAMRVQAPLYTLKARLFPGSTFVVGYDTAIRLVMPKYYGGENGMLLQFAELKHAGCRQATEACA